MNSVEKRTVLHCLKSMIDEALCEECPLYGITGTDHCEEDCVRFAISTLEQDSKIGIDYINTQRNELLDKIRTEIDYLPKLYPFADHIDSYVKDTDVLAIIDKYIGRK